MVAQGKLGFVAVVVDPRSYINILYLFLSFPLGIAYFVFLVTGISVGFGLIVIWVGVPILVLVLVGSWVLCHFERVLAVGLLKEDIPPLARNVASGQGEIGDPSLSSGERLFIGAWRRLKAHLTNRLTWTGMFYLLLKFPVGIASFTVAVTLISVTFALLGAPLYYGVDDGLDMGIWQVDMLWEALILMLIGIPLVFISLHLMNLMAFASGRLARVMLGRLH